MYAVLVNYGGYMLVGVLIVGTVILGLRTNRYQVAYLKKLPPVKGVPLYMVWETYPFGPKWQAMHQPHADPKLELMRREARRTYRQLVYWMFGFPALGIGVAALVLAFFPH